MALHHVAAYPVAVAQCPFEVYVGAGLQVAEIGAVQGFGDGFYREGGPRSLNHGETGTGDHDRLRHFQIVKNPVRHHDKSRSVKRLDGSDLFDDSRKHCLIFGRRGPGG